MTDWAGPDVQIRGIAIRLGAPAYPYDTFTFTGEVTGPVEIGDRLRVGWNEIDDELTLPIWTKVDR